MTGFCAGRSAGKSKIGTIHISQTAKPGDPWMAISPDNNMIRETTLPTFLETVRFSGQYIDHVLSPTPRVWFRTIWGGQAELVFKGAEVPDKLRGPNKAGIWFDEASIISKEAFDVAIACCRFRGKMGPVLATFTPRGFKHWTFESFYDGIDESSIGHAYDREKVEWMQSKPFVPRKDTFLVRCATRENPFAPPEYVGRIGQNYSSTLALQELEGDFIEISGLIFKREWFSQTVDQAPIDCMRVRFWDKAACLIPGTLITTNRGEFPIEEVTTDDMVLTRAGWKRLSFAGPTKIARSLVTVLFSDESTVTCTPEHRIWCNKSGGWIEAKDLNGYSKCVTHFPTTAEDLSCQGQETRTLKQSISTVSPTQDTLKAPALASNGTSTPTSRIVLASTSTEACIETFGCTFGEKYPVAIMSTTLTETGTTTVSTIFNASHPPSIGQSTHLKCLIQILSEKQERLLSGTLPGSGSRQECASAAEVNTTQDALRQNSVRTSVMSSQGTKRAGRITSRKNHLGSSAESAGANFRHTEPKSTAQPSALGYTETELPSRLGIPVYDLTVSDGPPEFFANGTLVHNSANAGCATVGLLMARDSRGIYYIEDEVRGQWSAHERNNIMLQTARSDAIKYGGTVLTYIEQEGGGDGKTVIDQLIVMLSAYPVYRWSTSTASSWKTKGNVRLPGDAKVRRARPFSAQCEAGNIRLVLGPTNGRWHRDFIEEYCAFPEFAFADRVDAGASAFNVLQSLGPNFGDVTATRSTEVAPQSRYGHTAAHSDGNSISRWGDLPWNQSTNNSDEY